MLSDVRALQVHVRELMLPERAGEVVTDKDVLSWLGIGSYEALFPCPPDMHIPDPCVVRSVASDVVDIYDAQTGLWSTAALSVPRGFVAAVTVGNLALFAGV